MDFAWTVLLSAATVLGTNFYAEDDRLAALIDEAVSNNPGLGASRATHAAAVERASQADALPDPMLTFTQALRSVETRVGPQYNVLAVSQRLPWFGKRALMEKAASLGAAAELEAYRAAERELGLRVKAAYYEIAHIDRALEIARDERALLEHYESLARDGYAAGRGTQHGVLKLQTALTMLANRTDELGSRRETAQFRLNELSNRPLGDELAPLALPDPIEAALDVEHLIALGEENRPELRSAAARIAGSGARIELAEKSPWPDLVLGLGFLNVGERSDAAGIAMPPPDNGKNAVSLSVGLSLPLFQEKYDAALREASEQQSSERSRQRALVNAFALSVRERVSKLETLRRQMTLFDTVLLPQAGATLRATELAYESSQLPVLELLDSESALLELRLMRAELDRDYRLALAELERAIGTRFPR